MFRKQTVKFSKWERKATLPRRKSRPLKANLSPHPASLLDCRIGLSQPTKVKKKAREVQRCHATKIKAKRQLMLRVSSGSHHSGTWKKLPKAVKLRKIKSTRTTPMKRELNAQVATLKRSRSNLRFSKDSSAFRNKPATKRQSLRSSLLCQRTRPSPWSANPNKLKK